MVKHSAMAVIIVSLVIITLPLDVTKLFLKRLCGSESRDSVYDILHFPMSSLNVPIVLWQIHGEGTQVPGPILALKC